MVFSKNMRTVSDWAGLTCPWGMNAIEFMTSHKLATGVAATVLVLATAALIFSRVKKVAPVSWGWYGIINETDNLALAGRDAVSYHKASEPQDGNHEFSMRYQEAEWRFENAENLALFTNNPQRYAPAFGGFCAFAVSKGFTADANRDVWVVQDEKLYVFDSTSIREDWLAAVEDNIIGAAEKNWAER